MALNYLIQDYQKPDFAFPDQNVEPKEKMDKAYALATAEAIYSTHAREKTAISPTMQDRFATLRLYGAGKQPSEKYRKLLVNRYDENVSGIEGGLELAEQRRKAWDNIDFDNKVTYAPKVEDHFYGLFMDIEQDIIGYPIDRESGEKMKSKKLRMLSELKFKKELTQLRKKFNIEQPQWDFFPMNKAELDLFESAQGFKLNYTKAMEKLMKYTFKESVWSSLRKHYVRDVLHTGYIGGKLSENVDTGETTVDYVDPEYSIVQHSNYDDFRDIEFAAELKPWTLTALGKYFSDEEIVDIANKYAGKMGNPGQTIQMQTGYSLDLDKVGHYKVPVLQAYYIDFEDSYQKEYTNPYKRKRLIDVPYGYEAKNNNEKVIKTRRRYVYQVFWIVGSKLVFNYGKAPNQLKEGKEVKLPFVFLKVTDTPITERLITLYDQLEIGWLKFQNAQAMAISSGFAIDMHMLGKVTINGEQISPIEALKFMYETGNLIYSSLDMGFDKRYEGGAVTPVHPIEGGMRNDLEEGIAKFEWTIRMIEYITGLSNVSMGVQAASEATVGATQLSVAGSENITQHHLAAIMDLKGGLSERAMYNLQLKLKFDEQLKKHYGAIIGEKDVEAIVQATKKGAKFGIIFQPRPTRAEKMELYKTIDQMASAGKNGQFLLKADEAWMLKEQLLTGGNLKDIGLRLAYKIRRREQELVEQQFAAREQQNQHSLQQNQQKFQQELEKDKMKYQSTFGVEQMKQQEETKRTTYKANMELKETLWRLMRDEQEMFSKEKQKFAEIATK